MLGGKELEKVIGRNIQEQKTVVDVNTLDLIRSIAQNRLADKANTSLLIKGNDVTANYRVIDIKLIGKTQENLGYYAISGFVKDSNDEPVEMLNTLFITSGELNESLTLPNLPPAAVSLLVNDLLLGEDFDYDISHDREIFNQIRTGFLTYSEGCRLRKERKPSQKANNPRNDT